MLAGLRPQILYWQVPQILDNFVHSKYAVKKKGVIYAQGTTKSK